MTQNYRIPIYRVTLVREGTIAHPTRLVDDIESAATLARGFIGDSDDEHFIAILVDTKSRVIGIHTVSIGTLDQTIATPRDVVKPALLANAAGVILVHNHPSGDPSPSQMDIRVTIEIQQACRLFTIALLDHLILGYDRVVSLTDLGHIRPNY